MADQQLEQELEAARAEAAANLEMAKYQKAEFENFKRRKLEAVSDALREGRTNVILDILPLLDSLYMGLAGTKDKTAHEGLEIIIRKFNQILEGFDVVAFESLGQPFDANLHNAVAAEESNQPPDTVIAEWQRGYKMNGKVIRVATVKISKKEEK